MSSSRQKRTSSLANTCLETGLAQRVGFEPTGRFLADQTISSRSRYDRFDTAACLIVVSELTKTVRKKERIHGENSPRNASAAYPESLEKSSIFERSLPIRGLDFESGHVKTLYGGSNCRLHFPKPIRTLRFFSSEQFSRLLR